MGVIDLAAKITHAFLTRVRSTRAVKTMLIYLGSSTASAIWYIQRGITKIIH